jgi:hypothetical protein
LPCKKLGKNPKYCLLVPPFHQARSLAEGQKAR